MGVRERALTETQGEALGWVPPALQAGRRGVGNTSGMAAELQGYPPRVACLRPVGPVRISWVLKVPWLRRAVRAAGPLG